MNRIYTKDLILFILNTMMCGGYGDVTVADEQIQQVADSVKASVESRMNTTLNTYKAISYKSQIVAGTNYKIKVQVGDDKYIHIKVFADLPCYGGEIELTDFKADCSVDSDLDFF